MKKDEFRRKIVLAFVEKGLIALIIAAVGFYFNKALKNIEASSQMAIQKEITRRDALSQNFNLLRDSLLKENHLKVLEFQEILRQENDQLNHLLKQSELALVNEYKRELEYERQDFQNLQNEITRAHQDQLQNERKRFEKDIIDKELSHEKEVVRLQSLFEESVQSKIAILSSSLEGQLAQLNAYLNLEGKVNTQYLEKLGFIWNKIYELDRSMEGIIEDIERVVEISNRPAVNLGTPASLFGWKEKKIKKRLKEYKKLKDELFVTFSKERFWLKDKTLEELRLYIESMDRIIEYSQIDRFRFLFPKQQYENLINKDSLNNLFDLKSRQRKTVFDEAEKLKNQLFYSEI